MKKLISDPRLQKLAEKAARMIKPLAQILAIAGSLHEDPARAEKPKPSARRVARRQFKAGKDL
jgi:hypothetical protein